MFKDLFRKKTAEEKFWSWFKNCEELYFRFEIDRDRLFGLLNKELTKIHSDLVFEFGPVENGKREFVISANGIKSAFPFVISLAESAPPLEKWTIIRFRQGRGPSEISYGSVQLDSSDIYFEHAVDNDKIGIRLHIKDYVDNPEWGMAIFIILDSTIGEYNTEMRISWIEKTRLDESRISSLKPLSDLPRIIDQLKIALN